MYKLQVSSIGFTKSLLQLEFVFLMAKVVKLGLVKFTQLSLLAK